VLVVVKIYRFWDQEIENRWGKQHPLLDKCTTMVREKLFIRILEMDK
jgi:hypothetical protein